MMSSTTLAPWEQRLFALAGADNGSWTPAVANLQAARDLTDACAQLKAAYAHCDALTARHSRSFHLAARLLPSAKRPAMHALYAFCRVSDDIADCSGPDAPQKLAAWQAAALAPEPPAGDPVARAWVHTRRRYAIPQRYALQLLEGVGRDLVQTRYDSFEELTTYAYGVASTVGLMSMHITGFSSPQAIPYAVRLGVALQLTNILRDVGEDWRAGRLYLPQHELAKFGLHESDVAAGAIDARWRGFMRFQIVRNRCLYRQAWPGIALLDQDGRLAITAAARLYAAILDDIEAHDYDVFSRRAHVPRSRKLLELARAWRYVQTLPRQEESNGTG